MYQISLYVPFTHAEVVKESMFRAGAGKLGNYAKCSFESGGLGQFEALDGAQPFLGQINKLEKVKELKVEMICTEDALGPSIEALKESHPYETPAYYVTKLVQV